MVAEKSSTMGRRQRNLVESGEKSEEMKRLNRQNATKGASKGGIVCN